MKGVVLYLRRVFKVPDGMLVLKGYDLFYEIIIYIGGDPTEGAESAGG